jgi:hypothetical protein
MIEISKLHFLILNTAKDTELVSIETQLEKMTESEKRLKRRAQQRKQMITKLCQRLFVAFIGEICSSIHTLSTESSVERVTYIK